MRTWILVVVIALAACGKDKAAGGPAVVPGAAAGDVIEVVGVVTAKRDAKMRQLAVGDEVAGDDVIATAPGASVVIQLRHNGVRWSLQGGQDKRLADAAAWKAAAKGDSTASLGERTTAAGRHAEREAAETGASAERMAAPETEMEEAAAPAMAEGSRGLVAPSAPTPTTGAPSPGAPSPGTPSPQPVPMTPSLKIGVMVEGPLEQFEVGVGVDKRRDALLLCTSSTGSGSVTFTVGTDGKVADLVIDAGTLTMSEACVREALSSLTFSAQDAPTTISLSFNR